MTAVSEGKFYPLHLESGNCIYSKFTASMNSRSGFCSQKLVKNLRTIWMSMRSKLITRLVGEKRFWWFHLVHRKRQIGIFEQGTHGGYIFEKYCASGSIVSASWVVEESAKKGNMPPWIKVPLKFSKIVLRECQNGIPCVGYWA